MLYKSLSLPFKYTRTHTVPLLPLKPRKQPSNQITSQHEPQVENTNKAESYFIVVSR